MTEKKIVSWNPWFMFEEKKKNKKTGTFNKRLLSDEPDSLQLISTLFF